MQSGKAEKLGGKRLDVREQQKNDQAQLKKSQALIRTVSLQLPSCTRNPLPTRYLLCPAVFNLAVQLTSFLLAPFEAFCYHAKLVYPLCCRNPQAVKAMLLSGLWFLWVLSLQYGSTQFTPQTLIGAVPVSLAAGAWNDAAKAVIDLAKLYWFPLDL